ncbi:MAG: beta-ketoacyl-[acyl-carrier-protein] synthase family protein [Tannerellaceae bacterium]|nr:beta-ketoacyl-[acyl-carrier-protein] synthase family protein [Tannerellaceae bacterium]
MKVFISGIGVVSGIGMNAEEHLDSFRCGRNGLGKVTLFPTRREEPVCEVKADNAALKEYLGITSREHISRTALLGMVAAREAFQDGDLASLHPLRIGLISSTSTGGMDLTEHFYPLFRSDHRKGRLRNIVGYDPGESTGRIASYLGIKDFRTTISTGCSSSANAILMGVRMIRQGLLDVVVAGGTDALSKFILNGFASLGILDDEPCRPFDDSRAGLNPGEGAGYVVLQSETTLFKKPYCELAGYANTNDVFHVPASPETANGAFFAMKQALEKAGIQPGEIDYIHAHGTGIPEKDASESRAISHLFGTNIPPFSSTKPFIGHTLGAAGGVDAVLSVLSIEKGIHFPNLNFKEPVAGTGLIPVTEYKEKLPVRTVLSNSFGFGGNNTSLIFRKVEK